MNFDGTASNAGPPELSSLTLRRINGPGAEAVEAGLERGSDGAVTMQQRNAGGSGNLSKAARPFWILCALAHFITNEAPRSSLNHEWCGHRLSIVLSDPGTTASTRKGVHGLCRGLRVNDARIEHLALHLPGDSLGDGAQTLGWVGIVELETYLLQCQGSSGLHTPETSS